MVAMSLQEVATQVLTLIQMDKLQKVAVHPAELGQVVRFCCESGMPTWGRTVLLLLEVQVLLRVAGGMAKVVPVESASNTVNR